MLRDQLMEPNAFKDPEFSAMQSYLGAHWDVVFLFETMLTAPTNEVRPKEPYVEAAFYDLGDLPKSEMSEDHLEVLTEMLQPSED